MPRIRLPGLRADCYSTAPLPSKRGCRTSFSLLMYSQLCNPTPQTHRPPSIPVTSSTCSTSHLCDLRHSPLQTQEITTYQITRLIWFNNRYTQTQPLYITFQPSRPFHARTQATQALLHLQLSSCQGAHATCDADLSQTFERTLFSTVSQLYVNPKNVHTLFSTDPLNLRGRVALHCANVACRQVRSG